MATVRQSIKRLKAGLMATTEEAPAAEEIIGWAREARPGQNLSGIKDMPGLRMCCCDRFNKEAITVREARRDSGGRDRGHRCDRTKWIL
jgi:ribosomal protein S2